MDVPHKTFNCAGLSPHDENIITAARSTIIFFINTPYYYSD